MTDLLKAAGREYTLFVEPQDFEAYKAHHENVIELEENNRVIGFARLSIQNFAPCGARKIYCPVSRSDSRWRGRPP